MPRADRREAEVTLKGVVRYDGTGFSGWQRQHHARTVQGEIERALSQIANSAIQVQGASRTDAGVHALGQVFSCRWPGAPPERLRHAVSMMLKPEVQVVSLEQVEDGFNARFGARGKRYAYSIDLGREPHPFAARYAWHVPHPLDLDLMREAIASLLGTHDFAGFQSAGTEPKENTTRTLWQVDVCEGALIGPRDAQGLWRLEFHGDAFLYRMVRNITGSLVEVARGRYPAEFLAEQLRSGGPFRGHCAPGHGLCLVEVEYGFGKPAA